ncbi:hypothetical protein TrVFT333_011857 [Trichoderma virens FT-333]|nr:hypothetical protein TrVFT333_011857 [Trichoderma virens FT-333]
MASPVVRITPNELHFSDPEFHSEIYSGHKNPKDKYAPFYHFTGATQSAFETHDHKLHNSRRQPLMSAFSKRSIVAIEPLILEKVNMLSQRFETAYLNKTVIKLDSAFSALTADITSQYAYGRCFGYLEDKDFKNDIRESLLASLTLFHIVRFFPIVMKGAKVLPFRVVQSLNPMLSKVLGLRKLINAITIEELHTMKQGKTSDAMLIQVLNNPSIPESERSLERLNDEGFVFMNAGTTTGKTLAFIMFHLLKDNGAYYSVLQQELIKTFPEGMEHLTWKDLETLPYLTTVCENVSLQGYDDAWSVIKWMYSHNLELNTLSGSISIGGISAGGHTSEVCHQLVRDTRLLLRLAILAMSAITLHLDLNKAVDSTYPSFVKNEFSLCLDWQRMKFFIDNIVPKYDAQQGGIENHLRFLASPIDGDLRGVCKTFVSTAKFDLVWDKSEAYAQKLWEAGVAVTVRRYTGVPH